MNWLSYVPILKREITSLFPTLGTKVHSFWEWIPIQHFLVEAVNFNPPRSWNSSIPFQTNGGVELNHETKILAAKSALRKKWNIRLLLFGYLHIWGWLIWHPDGMVVTSNIHKYLVAGTSGCDVNSQYRTPKTDVC